MEVKAWSSGKPILLLSAILAGNAWAQHDMGFKRVWPPVTCNRDFGQAISLKAVPAIAQNKLKSITLEFTHQSDDTLKVTPARMAFFSLPAGKAIVPTGIRKYDSRTSLEGRVTDAIEITFTSDPLIKNIAFIFEESALVSIRDGHRSPVDVNESLRLMDVADALAADTGKPSHYPCPPGLANWQPKERLERRLQASDISVGLDAADEVIRDAAVAPPENLILAAFHLFRGERQAEAVYWMGAGIYRATYVQKPSIGYGYYIAATNSIMEYARSTPDLWANSLQKVVQWDEKTYSQWEAEQEFSQKESAAWKKNRAYQREDTLKYVQQLRKDPKSPALGGIFPVSPADPLRNAIEKGDQQSALTVIRIGKIDLNRLYPFQNSYLHLAASKGFTDLIAEMIARGASTESIDELGNTPLGWARDMPTMQILLQKGANANALQGLDKVPMLYRLVSSGTRQRLGKNEKEEATACIELLLKYGADVTKGDSYGLTPMHAAAMRGDIAQMTLLLDHGAQVNAATTTDRNHDVASTPLAMAKDVGAARFLIEKGASLAPSEGDAPLLTAVRDGNVELAKLLLDMGSDPNSTTRVSQNNALYYAIISNDNKHLAVTELLIKAGANVKSTVRGKSLLAWAIDFGNKAAVKLLQDAGA